MNKKWFWLLSLIVLLVVIGFVFLTRSDERVSDKSLNTQQDVTPAVYTNSTFGFRLTPPSSWQGYGVDEEIKDDVFIVYFIFPTESEGWFKTSPLVAVSASTIAKWEEIERMSMEFGGPGAGIEITRNQTHVFTYSYPNDVPPDWDNRIFSNAVIEDFISSFEFVR